ncbi:MAG: transaldolase, partial [Lysobacterales bacterium]
MMNQLEKLQQYTTLVADTGDIESMRLYQPEDATTNPSLLLKAVGLPHYESQLK